MKVTFYGTRGSCPTPGPNTIKYGGNTACVLVESKQGHKLIVDSGTGIKALGDSMVKQQEDIYLLLSHNHYDHIQGFPFFKPLYQVNRNIHIYPAKTTPYQPEAILEQLDGSYFPLEREQLKANCQIVEPTWHAQPIVINGFNVLSQPINHPNGGSAYIIEYANKRVAYVTDNELSPPKNAETSINQTSIEQWRSLLFNMDLVIHDGQYEDKDMPLKHGWGHSLISDVIKLVDDCKIKKLAIYSHDPDRTDEEINQWQDRINNMGLAGEIFFAAEGQTITL